MVSHDDLFLIGLNICHEICLFKMHPALGGVLHSQYLFYSTLLRRGTTSPLLLTRSLDDICFHYTQNIDCISCYLPFTNTISGAGAGGSSSAYHLQKYAAESDLAINVTVFERSSYIGGRSTTVNAYGNSLEPVELGASIFVEVNAILKNASREFGLRPKSSETEEAEVLGIWNGVEFVYTQKDSDWKYWDIAKMLWKYGLAPLKTQRLVKTVVGRFMQLYEAPYFPFRSLTERVEELDLKTVASVTGEQYLADNDVSLALYPLSP